MKGLNRILTEYIATEWISKSKSNRAFAIEHNIDEKTVRRIVNPNDDYQMELETLEKICEARNLKLWEFFKLVGL
jgi:DNA-binding Xre family transcriptional regulator